MKHSGIRAITGTRLRSRGRSVGLRRDRSDSQNNSVRFTHRRAVPERSGAAL